MSKPPTMPALDPQRSRRTGLRNVERITSRGCAPNAMRMPCSFMRFETSSLPYLALRDAKDEVHAFAPLPFGSRLEGSNIVAIMV